MCNNIHRITNQLDQKLTFNINARQLMSSIASTRMMSGCSILIRTVIFSFGLVSAAETTSAAEMKIEHEMITKKKVFGTIILFTFGCSGGGQSR